MKSIRFLLISAAVALGLNYAYADSGAAQASLDNFAATSGAQLSLAVPVPSMWTATPILTSGGNANCKPNSAILPGSDFSPHISDAVRTQAIKDLLTKIAKCASLPYSQDGVVNNNKEGGMPQEAAGYYHEYTLVVPGRKTGDGAVPVVIGGKTYETGTMESARGPERIIIGGGSEIYYTMDHYTTFLRLTIVP
jgi:ribonuclease T1